MTSKYRNFILQIRALFGPRIIHEALNGLDGGLIHKNNTVHAILQLESVWNVQVQSILSGYESVENNSDSISTFSKDVNQEEKVKLCLHLTSAFASSFVC